MLKKGNIYYAIIGLLIICGVFLLGLRLYRAAAESGSETAALEKILNTTGVKPMNMPDDGYIRQNFPAVKRLYAVDGALAGVLTQPVGYLGAVTVMVGIDSAGGTVAGIEIMGHEDTPDYADPIKEPWFTGRFANKSLAKNVRLVTLEAENDSDIIQVTGATVTSQAVVNGVNSAIGVWRYMNGLGEADAVPLTVSQEMWALDDNSFVITWPGGQKRVSQEEINTFKHVTESVKLHKTTGTVIDMTVTGPYLADVLEKCGLNLSDYEGIGVTGRDGYYTLIDKEKLQQPIILAVRQNGKELGREDKPVRLVLPGEMGPYWVKMVSEISLYTEISPKDIKTVYDFEALTRDIEPYYYEYYGSKDKAYEVGKILRKLGGADVNGFFTMTSADGLIKNETISMVTERYYIKTEGDNAPMNISPGFKLGMNVKDICCFSTTTDAVFFPEQMKAVSRTELIGGAEMINFEDILINAGLGVGEADTLIIGDCAGNTFSIDGGGIAACRLTAGPTVDLYKDGILFVTDFLYAAVQ